MSHPDQDAIHLYPELHSLITMREAGWRFRQHVNNEGEVFQLDAFRFDSGYMDVMRVRDRTDVFGMRVFSGGRVVWERHGTLPEVVNELLALPVLPVP